MTKIAFVFLVMLVISVGIVSGQDQDDSKIKWDKNGHYYSVIPKVVNWNDAKSISENHQFVDQQTGVIYKGHLATINSAEENSFISQNILSPLNAQNSGIWLGGFQETGYESRPRDGWHWITDEPWSWTNWNPDEPNDVNGGERHLEMWGSDMVCSDRPQERCPKIGMWNDEIFGGWSGVTRYILIEYEPNADQAILSTTTTTTSSGSGDVEISYLDNREFNGYEVTALYPGGKGIHNARVAIDNEVIGQTDTEGNFVSENRLAIGWHRLEVIYNPLPRSSGGDFIGIFNKDEYAQNILDRIAVGETGPGSINNAALYKYFYGDGTIYSGENAQKFTVTLNPAYSQKPATIENVVNSIIALATIAGKFVPRESSSGLSFFNENSYSGIQGNDIY